MRFLGFILLILYILLSLPAWSTPHALLIGIQNYTPAGFDSLQGPRNDVALVKTLLRNRFGFQEADITVLIDQQATHSSIQRAFARLAAKVQTEDFVYIHYAGHGSQQFDGEGDEQSGRKRRDETWVPYGARSGMTGIDGYDIPDDKIGTWLQPIYAKTDKVVFVSDSCHSASITRAGALMGRALPARAHPQRGVVLKAPEYHGIRVSAALDEHKENQEALAVETLAADGKMYGLFTWHWIQALYQAGAHTTWRQVFMRTFAKVTADDRTFQQPQLEGDASLLLRTFGFAAPRGGDAADSADNHRQVVVSKVDGRRVTLRAGHLNGVTKHSVYRNGATRVTIHEMGTFTSVGHSDGVLEIGDLLTEESHHWRFAPVPVYVSGDFPQDQAILDAVRAALNEDIRGYTLTEDPRQARYHLHLVRPQPAPGGAWIYANAHDSLPRSFPDREPQLWVLTPQQQLLHANLQIPFREVADGLSRLADNLHKILRVRELKALENPAQGEFPLSVAVVKLDPVAAPCAACFDTESVGYFRKSAVYPLDQAGDEDWQAGDIISFTLHNHSSEDWYVYLLNLGPDGQISVVSPHPGSQAETALLYAGKQRDLSDRDALRLAAGEENVRFLVTKKAVDVRVLAQGGFRDEGNPLERLLVSVGLGVRSEAAVEVDAWYTKLFTKEVAALRSR